ASLAASTASATSSSVESGNIPTSSPVLAGLRFSRALPLRDSTHSPLMKFLKTLGITAVAMRIPPWASWCVPVIDRDDDSMMQRPPETQSSKRLRRRQRAPAYRQLSRSARQCETEEEIDFRGWGEYKRRT